MTPEDAERVGRPMIEIPVQLSDKRDKTKS